jgi:hypothetical protein
MLFGDIIAPYPENYTKHINATCEKNGDYMRADHLEKNWDKKIRRDAETDPEQLLLFNLSHTFITIAAKWPFCS